MEIGDQRSNWWSVVKNVHRRRGTDIYRVCECLMVIKLVERRQRSTLLLRYLQIV